jgi:hypothetical protein
MPGVDFLVEHRAYMRDIAGRLGQAGTEISMKTDETTKLSNYMSNTLSICQYTPVHSMTFTIPNTPQATHRSQLNLATITAFMGG